MLNAQWLLLLALCSLLLASACSSVEYGHTLTSGEKFNFSSQALFMKRAFKDLEVASGDRHLTLKGYSTSQTEIMEAAIAAALAAYRQQSQMPAPPAAAPVPPIPAGTVVTWTNTALLPIAVTNSIIVLLAPAPPTK